MARQGVSTGGAGPSCATGALCAAAVCILLPVGAAHAGADHIVYPEGYQNDFTYYNTVNLADERKQVVKMFANDVALQSAKDGAPLDSGSVIVMEIYKAALDANEQPVLGADGFFVPAEMAGIAVMETRSGWGEDYPEEWRNDEWEFAAFKPDDHSLVERDYQPCFACHKPLAESGYLFSLKALEAASAKQASGG
ncbi:MAG TPA: cytochrome P460 family protein [Geminicoccaceae bacterium]|nr:cytochrome P460 family protein [Geminicoccaceae bacterium]